MAKAVQRHEWDQTSLLWSMFANANRDPAKRAKPFSPADVHPLRTHEEYETEESGSPDWGMIESIRQNYRVNKLNGRQRENQSGGSVPSADG